MLSRSGLIRIVRLHGIRVQISVNLLDSLRILSNPKDDLDPLSFRTMSAQLTGGKRDCFQRGTIKTKSDNLTRLPIDFPRRARARSCNFFSGGGINRSDIVIARVAYNVARDRLRRFVR